MIAVHFTIIHNFWRVRKNFFQKTNGRPETWRKYNGLLCSLDALLIRFARSWLFTQPLAIRHPWRNLALAHVVCASCCFSINLIRIAVSFTMQTLMSLCHASGRPDLSFRHVIITLVRNYRLCKQTSRMYVFHHGWEPLLNRPYEPFVCKDMSLYQPVTNAHIACILYQIEQRSPFLISL